MKQNVERLTRDKQSSTKHNSDKHVMGDSKNTSTQSKTHIDGGFSFPQPRDGLSKGNGLISDGTDGCLNTLIGNEKTSSSLATISSGWCTLANQTFKLTITHCIYFS